MKMPARPSRRSSPRPVPEYRAPRRDAPPITPRVIAETLPHKGTGKTSSEGVTTKKKPGQKQMESSTPSPPKPLKKPPIIQYDPTLYDWDEEDSDLILQLGPQQFLIDMDLLTEPFPVGMHMSPICKDWLLTLGIFTWGDFQLNAGKHTVESLMRFLMVDHYYQYRRDMRIFLTFGQLCTSASKTAGPMTKNRKTWIPMLMKQLQLNISLKTFPKLEQAAAHLLYKESHPSPPKPGIASTSGTGNGGRWRP